ncbi:MAG TPA: glycosyltransferase, partial [Abditibacteriaceae bacterium]|nr:glycosyltransferase [Abditibacteriaceae bacterium]
CFDTLGAATAYGRDHDTYLIDNGSTDESIAYAEKTFPWVKIIRSPRNAFLFTYNDVVPDLDTEAILLLNNDIIVEPDFIPPLLAHLHAPDVFAVNTRVLTGDRVTSQGSRTAGGYHRGLWWYHQLRDIERASTCFFALGGQAAFSRSKYLELGGFDELFWPLYHEDIDLSYRAWGRGWRVLYEPASVLYHLGAQTTTSKYKKDRLKSITTQNTYLLQWKNIHDPQMCREHWAWLPLRLSKAIVRRDRPFLAGFRAAFKRRKLAQQAKARQTSRRRIPDREIFNRIQAHINGLDS